MTDPYSRPTSYLQTATAARRFSHSLAALISGAILFPSLIIGAVHIFPRGAGYGNIVLWSAAVLGGLIGALVAYPFKKMPLWVAVILGPAMVIFVLVILAAWALYTGAV